MKRSTKARIFTWNFRNELQFAIFWDRICDFDTFCYCFCLSTRPANTRSQRSPSRTRTARQPQKLRAEPQRRNPSPNSLIFQTCAHILKTYSDKKSRWLKKWAVVGTLVRWPRPHVASLFPVRTTSRASWKLSLPQATTSWLSPSFTQGIYDTFHSRTYRSIFDTGELLTA